MQQLNVNLTIPIPNDYVMISKVELQELENHSLVGLYWTMKDLEKRTGRKIEWLKSNLLFVPQFRKVLDVNYGGFVYYPQAKGQAWSFQAQRMAHFLEDNFQKIFKEESA